MAEDEPASSADWTAQSRLAITVGGDRPSKWHTGISMRCLTENPYLADSLIDSIGLRSSLKFVEREEFAGFSAKGGVDIEAEVGTYYLNRGRKVYE